MKHLSFFGVKGYALLWSTTAMTTALITAVTSTVRVANADLIDDLKPGEWAEVPASHLETVKPDPLPRNQSGFAVMTAWSGGAGDVKRGRLLVWGGGHGDYAGNEIYAFDINTLKWSRLTNPSTDVGGDESSGLYPDGTPRARHTYDYIEYIPSIDAFCTFGGGAMYPTGGTGSRKTLCYDFTANKWSQKSDALAGGIGAISGYDPFTQKLWIQGTGNNPPLAEWDPVADVWKKHITYPAGWFPYPYTGAAGRGVFLAVGEGNTQMWNLSGADKFTTLTTTGDKDILAAKNAGFTFDSKTGLFVAWNGGSSVYAFDVDAKRWIKAPLATTNKVTPTAATSNGVFGRWQYFPSRNVYVGVNAVNENVFLYKLPDNLKSIVPVPPPVSVKPHGLISNPKNLKSGSTVSVGGFSPYRLSPEFLVNASVALTLRAADGRITEVPYTSIHFTR